MKHLYIILATAAIFLLPTVVHAQESPANDLAPLTIVSTIFYGILGIALCVLGYFAFDRIAGLDIQRELVEDQNMAIGIMLAGAFIGIAIVVAAVMIS